jgi:tetratricopeptide (TPR) repeat protein
MSTADPAALAEHFERLAELAPDAREAALAALDGELATRLRRLFAAESSAHDPIAAAIAAAAGVPSTQAGARLGAWRIVREIGSGGMGTVFLAERADGQFTQQAAIKLIRGFATEDGRRRLRQERQILSGLDHPNIARLLDGGETDDGQPWVAMEYVEGRELLDHVAHARLDLDARLQLFDRIAAAVQHAHQRLVVHRDIKPRNVLVRADGEPRLLDFGVAKLVDLGADTDGRDTSTRVWTPGYASPEQRRGAAVTTVTDVFSLGILLRELLTGRRDPDEAPQSLPHGFEALSPDADLRGALAKATAEEPAQRYASVEAFRDDLRRYRERRPLRAARDSAGYRLRKFLARHRLASGLALAATVALGFFVWRLDAERDRALIAERVAEQSSVDAQRSADNANRTLRFVVGLFKGASPEYTLGRSVTPRMLVDEARERLEAEVGEDPQALRRLQAALGQIYYELGESKLASELLQSATEGFEPLGRDDELWLAGSLTLLSQALAILGTFEQAQTAALSAADLFQRSAADDTEAALQVQMSRMSAACYAGDMAATVLHARSAIEKARAMQPMPEALATVDIYGARNLLADALKLSGDLPAADRESELLLADLERDLPEIHPWVLKAMRMRGSVLSSLGRYDEAIAMHRAGIDRVERLLGSESDLTAAFWNDLSNVLSDAGRFRESLAALERSMDMDRKLRRVETSALSFANLGSLQEEIGEYEMAVASMSRAVGLMRADSSASYHLQKAEGNLARALSLAGRHSEAKALFEKVRSESKAAGEARAFDYAFDTFRQGAAERLAGRLDAAAALFDESVPVLIAALGESHRVVGIIRRQRGHLAIERDDLELARADIAAAREVLERAGAGPFDLAVVDLSSAAMAAREGELALARRLLAAALPIVRDNVGPEQVNRVEAERLAQSLGMRL